MSRRTKLLRASVTLVFCVGLTTQMGCDRLLNAFSGSTINVNIPLGLNGAPGLFNPFGLTQTLVASWFGVSTGTNDGGNGGDAPAGGVDPNILVGGLNGGGGGAPPQ